MAACNRHRCAIFQASGGPMIRRLRTVVSRLRAVAHAEEVDRDLRDQIDAHLDELTEDYLRQGLSPTEARRAARLQFGNVVIVEETCRDERGTWYQDLSYDF